MAVVTAEAAFDRADGIGECPPYWLGDTVHARGLFLEDDGTPSAVSSVVFRWVRPDGPPIDVVGVPGPGSPPAYWECQLEATIPGVWAFRPQCENPSRQLAWRTFTVKAGFSDTAIASSPIWITDGDTALLTYGGGVLSAVRVNEMPVRHAFEATDRVLVVAGDNSSETVSGQAFIDAVGSAADSANEAGASAAAAEIRAAATQEARIAAESAAAGAQPISSLTGAPAGAFSLVDAAGFVGFQVSAAALSVPGSSSAQIRVNPTSLRYEFAVPGGWESPVRPSGDTMTGPLTVPALGLAAGGGLSTAPVPAIQSFADLAGFVVADIGADGSPRFPGASAIVGPASFSPGVASLGPAAFATVTSPSITAGSLSVVDGAGFVNARFDGNGITSAGVGAGTTGYSAAEIQARDAANRDAALLVPRQTVTAVTAPVWQINHAITDGQSMIEAYEGHPALSTSQPYDNLMVGQSGHPNSQARTSTTWAPIGSTTLNPLVANTVNGATILTPTDEAALSYTDTKRGELPGVGMLNTMRRLMLQRQGVASDASRRFALTDCSVYGESIENLMPGASPNLYNRVPTAAQAVKTAAGAMTAGLAAVAWAQGNYNYPGVGSAPYVGATDKASYKASLLSLREAFHTDVEVAIYGQAERAAWFISPPGGTDTSDGTQLSIAQAFLELGLENPGIFVTGPQYPYPKKDIHFTSNGCRWFGATIGKVMHRVLNLRESWRPLYPKAATARGQQVLIDFHVPFPPLVADTTWLQRTKTALWADLGISAYAADGTNIPCSATVAGSCTVLLQLASIPAAGAYLLFGDRTYHSGFTNLRDSDPAVASDLYTYTAGSGQDPTENIAELVGKPYPLWNWCVNCTLPITF